MLGRKLPARARVGPVHANSDVALVHEVGRSIASDLPADPAAATARTAAATPRGRDHGQIAQSSGALIAMRVARHHPVHDAHHSCTAPAAHETRQERPTAPPGLAAQIFLAVSILRNHLLVPLIFPPCDVAGVVVVNQDAPRRPWHAMPARLPRPPIDDMGSIAGTTKHVSASVQVVAQDQGHVGIERKFPGDAFPACAPIDDRHLQARAFDPEVHLSCGAELSKLCENEPDGLDDPIVRIELHTTKVVPAGRRALSK